MMSAEDAVLPFDRPVDMACTQTIDLTWAPSWALIDALGHSVEHARPERGCQGVFSGVDPVVPALSVLPGKQLRRGGEPVRRRRPSSNGPGTGLRLGVVGEAWEPPPELDPRRQLSRPRRPPTLGPWIFTDAPPITWKKPKLHLKAG